MTKAKDKFNDRMVRADGDYEFEIKKLDQERDDR